MFKRKHNNRIDNKGTTLIEMLVCFMMLAIFLTAAFSVITHISKIYYQVKGETYGKQVSDILLTKIQSEVEGAKTGEDVIYIDGDTSKTVGTSMKFYDKTNTQVELSTNNNVFQITYFGYKDETDPTGKSDRVTNIWKFDKNVYNSFYIKNLTYVKASTIGSGTNKSLAESYGISASDGEYGDDVMLVLLELDSHHYGSYKTYRFVKMYNVDANPSGGGTNP